MTTSASPLIKQMQLQRRTRFPEQQVTRVNSNEVSRPALDRRVARVLGADDPNEVEALLLEIETALARAGYHWRHSLAKRARRDTRAVRGARASPIGRAKPGRPAGVQNFAARQLCLELATIWHERTGRPPSRYESASGSNRASFTEFVTAIAETRPLMFRKSGPSPMPGVEYMVRTGIKDFRAARAAPEEYRRRGLIDEHAWLGSGVGDAQSLRPA